MPIHACRQVYRLLRVNWLLMDVTDPLTWVILASALVAMITAALHLYGWLPKRYTSRLRDVQAGLASNIGSEVEGALTRVSEAQQTKFKAEAAAAQAAFELEQAKAGKSVDMSITRAVRSLKDGAADINQELAQAILGPALPILRQFAPGLAERLEENPELIGVIIENPLFQRYVMPQIQKFLGQQREGTNVTTTGWGT